LLIQLVIVEQSVQLSQHRIGLLRQLGNSRKHIFSFILVNEHFLASLPLFCRFLLLSSIHVSSPTFVAHKPAPLSLLLGFSLHSAMLAQKTSACQAASQAHFAMQTSTRKQPVATPVHFLRQHLLIHKQNRYGYRQLTAV
jgi:hypothetical protein